MTAKIDVIIEGKYTAGAAFDALVKDTREAEGVVLPFSAKATGGFGGMVNSLADVAGGFSILTEVLETGQRVYEMVIGSSIKMAEEARKLSKELGSTEAAARKLGLTVSDETLQATLDLADAMERLKGQSASARMEFTAKLAPALEDLANIQAKVQEENDKNGLGFLKLIPAVGGAVDVFLAAKAAVDPTVTELGKLAAATGEVITQHVAEIPAVQAVGNAIDAAGDTVARFTDNVKDQALSLAENAVQTLQNIPAVDAYLKVVNGATGAVSGLVGEIWNEVDAMEAAKVAAEQAAEIEARYAEIIAARSNIQGIATGYNGWNPNRGANPVRENPVYEFLVPPGRATGVGSMVAGVPYLVNEGRPEVFTPGTNGTMTPVTNMGGDTYQISLSFPSMFPPSDPAQFERVFRPVAEKTFREMKATGRV